MDDSLNRTTLDRLRLPIAATLAGLWAERITRAFWPLWTVVLLTFAALGFNAHETLPVEAAWIGTLAVRRWRRSGPRLRGYGPFKAPTRERGGGAAGCVLPGGR